jgi:hypothetical protein
VESSLFVGGWGCSNHGGRTVTVNGLARTCGDFPLPSAINGYHYFSFSAGDLSFASFYWF